MALPLLLALVLLASLELSARRTSVTVDEFAHLPAGLVHLTRGEFAVYHHNPPLVRMLAAAVLLGADLDETGFGGARDPWRLGTEFMDHNRGSYVELFARARRVVMLLTLSTAALLFYAARRALGYGPAILALALFAFGPTEIAHGALVTTDAGHALAFFGVALCAAVFFRAPTAANTTLLGAVLGAALLTKFTALLLPPLLVAAAAALPWLARLAPGGGLLFLGLTRRARALRLLGVFALALFLVNAGYLFRGSGRPLSSFRLEHPALAAVARSPAGALPVPLPADYVEGFDDQYREAAGGRVVYLHGESSRRGWWYYYPAALLLKLPLPLFLLLGALFVALARRWLRATPLLVGCIAIPALSTALFATLTDIGIGVRYLLFALPFLYLAVAHLLIPTRRVPGLAVFVGVCLAWYAASSVASFPHYIAYFSDAVGGWRQGHRWLADSNLDWGQDLVHLRDAQRTGRLGTVALSHFGLVEPSIYGVAHEPLTPAPRAGTVAISINHLLGIHPFHEEVAAGPYRDRTPIGRVGASLWLFEPAVTPPRPRRSGPARDASR